MCNRWALNLDEVHFPAELIAAGQGQNPDPRLALVLEGQRQLFSSRRQALAREQSGLQASEGAGLQLAGMRRARSDLLAQADSLRQQLRNLEPLAQNGFIPGNRLLEFQRQLSQVQQSLAQNAGETGRIEQGIVESRLRLQQQREEYQKEVRSQWADAQVKALTLEQQLASAGFSLQHSAILAPADGIAVNMLLEIVPQGTRLEVEGRLPVQLIDKVASHLPVDILFTAFNQSRTPRVAGEVSLISADQMQDEKTGQPYYVLRTSVGDAALEKLNGRMIRYPLKAALLTAILLGTAPLSHAMGPFQVYELALRNDPTYLGALKERDAGLENRIIGRAGLLPRVSYNYNKGRNDSKATLKGGREDTTDHRHYNSFGSSLTIQQPLIDYEAYANYRKGLAQALFADETFRSKSQESAGVRAPVFAQNRQMFQQGEGTRTDILEAESRNELAIAEQIEASDEQDAALRELAALLGEPGIDVAQLDPLKDSFQALVLAPSSFTEWHALATANSPTLASQRQAVICRR
ncbi:hypothetical protein GCM10009085_02710 [Pseudomonas avellanae]|nr:hypothetical protein GCM10009085_02710 [Pseudomonas avellanae]